MDLLNELGALVDGKLTKLGRRLAQLPLDPRLARMVAQARAYQGGGNLFDDMVASEVTAGVRMVTSNSHWVAFVP